MARAPRGHVPPATNLRTLNRAQSRIHEGVGRVKGAVFGPGRVLVRGVMVGQEPTPFPGVWEEAVRCPGIHPLRTGKVRISEAA